MAKQTNILHDKAQRRALEISAAGMCTIIEKELIHYDIFKALADTDASRNFVFQGGTCLRLCYGSPRLSEDLDFSLGSHFQSVEKHKIKEIIEEYLYSKYGQIGIVVKEPAFNKVNQDVALNVDHWEIRINTTPDRSDIPLQRIHFEAASVPSYTGSSQEIKVNYPELEGEFSGIKVVAENLDEICADKIVSLAMAAQQGRTRWRDLWDIPWIMEQESFHKDTAIQLVGRKVQDYNCETVFDTALKSLYTNLPLLVKSPDFLQVMGRFLIPKDLNSTVGNKDYQFQMLARLQNIYEATAVELGFQKVKPLSLSDISQDKLRVISKELAAGQPTRIIDTPER